MLNKCPKHVPVTFLGLFWMFWVPSGTFFDIFFLEDPKRGHSIFFGHVKGIPYFLACSWVRPLGSNIQVLQSGLAYARDCRDDYVALDG